MHRVPCRLQLSSDDRCSGQSVLSRHIFTGRSECMHALSCRVLLRVNFRRPDRLSGIKILDFSCVLFFSFCFIGYLHARTKTNKTSNKLKETQTKKQTNKNKTTKKAKCKSKPLLTHTLIHLFHHHHTHNSAANTAAGRRQAARSAMRALAARTLRLPPVTLASGALLEIQTASPVLKAMHARRHRTAPTLPHRRCALLVAGAMV